MSKQTKLQNRAGSRKTTEPRPIRDLLREYLASDQPLAQQLRDELFRSLFPNTELDVDLKLLTRRPGRLAEGERLHGVIERDGEEHFTFVENAAEKEIAHSSTEPPLMAAHSLTEQPLAADSPRLESMPQTVRRYPKVYEGQCINVSRMDDGTLRLTFKHPRFSRNYTFLDFCLEAANELETVAYSLDQNVSALSE